MKKLNLTLIIISLISILIVLGTLIFIRYLNFSPVLIGFDSKELLTLSKKNSSNYEIYKSADSFNLLDRESKKVLIYNENWQQISSVDLSRFNDTIISIYYSNRILLIQTGIINSDSANIDNNKLTVYDYKNSKVVSTVNLDDNIFLYSIDKPYLIKGLNTIYNVQLITIDNESLKYSSIEFEHDQKSNSIRFYNKGFITENKLKEKKSLFINDFNKQDDLNQKYFCRDDRGNYEDSSVKNIVTLCQNSYIKFNDSLIGFGATNKITVFNHIETNSFIFNLEDTLESQSPIIGNKLVTDNKYIYTIQQRDDKIIILKFIPKYTTFQWKNI